MSNPEQISFLPDPEQAGQAEDLAAKAAFIAEHAERRDPVHRPSEAAIDQGHAEDPGVVEARPARIQESIAAAHAATRRPPTVEPGFRIRRTEDFIKAAQENIRDSN